MERVLSKREILVETIKLLGGVELPVSNARAINNIQGGIRNIGIVVQMLDAEEKAEKEQKDGAENGGN
jgi:hypothetical protein